MLAHGGDKAGAVVGGDVCVVGAGPVGIAIAQSLAGSGRRTVVLESGGIDYEMSPRRPLEIIRNHMVGPQSLSRGRNVGQAYTPLRFSRARAFGGSTRVLLDHGLMARPLDPIDFLRRPGFERSGWPFQMDELREFYEVAEALAGLGPLDYAPGRFEAATGLARIPTGDTGVETTMYQFGKRETFFGYLDSLAQAPDVELILDSTVVGVDMASGGDSVQGLRVRTLSGQQYSVGAEVFILAMGGIENARFLLLDRNEGGLGIGNESGLVGRHFMEHHQVLAGIWWPARDVGEHLPFYGMLPLDDYHTMAQLRLSDSVLASEGLLNSTAYLLPTRPTGSRSGVLAAKQLRMSFNQRFPLPGFWGNTRRAVLGAADIVRHVSTGRTSRAHVGSAIGLSVMAEQEPNPESRVRLGRRYDRMGQKEAVLDWRLTHRDVESIRRTVAEISARLEAEGLGSVDSLVDGPASTMPIHGNWHHMGTTRMDDDPTRGIVDRNSKVHGCGNLFVTGTSVFPTGGCSNPTLTGVALGLRLAEHVKGLARSG